MTFMMIRGNGVSVLPLEAHVAYQFHEHLIQIYIQADQPPARTDHIFTDHHRLLYNYYSFYHPTTCLSQILAYNMFGAVNALGSSSILQSALPRPPSNLTPTLYSTFPRINS